MNPEKSSTTRNQKNQTHEPRKIKPMNPWIKSREIAWTHEPMNQTHEPMNQNPWIKRERKRDSGLEREKKSEIDKERSKRTIQTQKTQTSKSSFHQMPLISNFLPLTFNQNHLRFLHLKLLFFDLTLSLSVPLSQSSHCSSPLIAAATAAIKLVRPS